MLPNQIPKKKKKRQTHEQAWFRTIEVVHVTGTRALAINIKKYCRVLNRQKLVHNSNCRSEAITNLYSKKVKTWV